VFTEVQKTLASLGRPGSVVVANLRLLATEVIAESLGLDGVGAEPKELLLETGELPADIC
jgi:hypothetical protein